MQCLLKILIFSVLFSSQQVYGQGCGERYFQKIFTKTLVTRNIYYGENLMSNGQLKRLHFDVYEPQDDTERSRPVLVMMHGGAYWSGDKNHGQCKFLGEDLSKMGYVVISPQYRYEPSFLSLLNEEKMVKAVARGTQDAKAIIRYLFKDVMESGNTWGIDTSMIFIGGASAGSFNALHATYLDENDELPAQWKQWIEEAGGIDGTTAAEGYPYKVAGVINISGALAKASILDNEHIPFLSVHDTGDPQIPFNTGQPYGIVLLPNVDGSNVLHAKALELGIENPFYIIPGNGHTSYEEFGMRIQPMYDSTLYYIKQFMSGIYCRKYQPTGIVRHLQLANLKVYPNPSQGILSVRLPSTGIPSSGYTLQLLDITGRTLRTDQIYTVTHMLDLSDFSAGVYQAVLFAEEKALARASIQLVK